MTFEMQELLKQYKREVAIAQANEDIKASADFVKTEFETELEQKANLAKAVEANKVG